VVVVVRVPLLANSAALRLRALLMLRPPRPLPR